MNRFISWSILLLFLVNTGGFYYIFKIKEYRIKKEIKSKIKKGVPEDELKTFVISEANKHEFEWEHSKEFEYHGKMYDVVYRSKHSDGSEILKCVSDDQETALFKHLDKCLQQHLAANNHGNHPLVQYHFFLSHLFFENDDTKVFHDYYFEGTHLMHPNNVYTAPNLGISSPPPEV